MIKINIVVSIKHYLYPSNLYYNNQSIHSNHNLWRIFKKFTKFLNLSSIITISGGIILIINIILTLYIFNFRIQLPGIIICILISTIYGIASGMTMVGLCINFHPSISFGFVTIFCFFVTLSVTYSNESQYSCFFAFEVLGILVLIGC